MRIDKFLKNSRIIKRRSIAKEACESGRVFINGRKAKPGSEVNVEDEIFIQFGKSELKVKVLETKENARKEEAETMYEIMC